MTAPRPHVIAHRGHSAAATENSLAALDLAVAAGADAVECDVRIAGDGVLVVSHDADLERLTGRADPVDSTPSDRLEALARAAGTSILPLATLMASARGRVPLMLDVKSLDPAVVAGIAGAAASVGFGAGDLVVGLRTPDLVADVRAALPDARILALHGAYGSLDTFREQNVTLIRLWEAGATPQAIEDLQRDGCTVWVTTGGPETGRAVGDADLATLETLIAAGADGLLVNDPDLGRQAVDG